MSTSPNNRNSLLRLSEIGGIIIGLLHLIVEDWHVFNLLYKSPFIFVLQFIASAALGNAAFAGGIATALPPPTPFQLIETIIDHMLTIGLPLGILLQRNK